MVRRDMIIYKCQCSLINLWFFCFGSYTHVYEYTATKIISLAWFFKKRSAWFYANIFFTPKL